MIIENSLQRLGTIANDLTKVGHYEPATAIRKAIAIIERNRPDDAATLRDQLAMTAAQAILSAPNMNYYTFDEVCDRAFAFADTYLEKRQQ